MATTPTAPLTTPETIGKKISIIIPCYNEEAGIEYLASRLNPVVEFLQKQYSIELIFVDDGSVDNTFSTLQKYFGVKEYVKIIRHKVNQNIGGALKTGFKNSTGDIIVTTDSDCTYDPNDIPKMLALLDEQTDLINASPYHPKGHVQGVPAYRVFLGKTISRIYQLITGYKVYTFTTIFRVYRRPVVENVFFKSNDFICFAEFMINSLMKRYRVKEFPTTLYVRQYGISKMKFINVIIRHLELIWHVLGLRLKGKFRPKVAKVA